MKIAFEQLALTKSGAKTYAVEIAETSPSQIECCLDKERFDKLCKLGCPNYNQKWSCPPFAPEFSGFAAGKEKLFIFYLRIGMAQYAYIQNRYLRIKAANTMLKSRADRFLRTLAPMYGSYLSTGSCRLCKPCKCKLGQQCAHPDLMTYSFEALGVDVGRLVESYFEQPLLWYRPHFVPEYTSVVCGLLTNDTITVHDLREKYLDFIVR